MKKIIALVICLTLTLSLSACSGGFWYPFNVMFENKNVEETEKVDIQDKDNGESTEEVDDTEEGKHKDKNDNKSDVENATSDKQVNNKERTNKYKITYSNSESDYRSFDLEHLDLDGSFEKDLIILKTKKDAKEFIKTHIGSMTSLEANGEYWQDDEEPDSMDCYYHTDRGEFSVHRMDNGECTVVDYRYQLAKDSEYDKAYAEFCDIVTNYFNVDIRKIAESEKVMKDAVLGKTKQTCVMLTIDGFDCESWLDISCGFDEYTKNGFLSYTFYAEHGNN